MVASSDSVVLGMPTAVLEQRRIAVQPFAERHGLAAAMVAPTKIIAGLGASLGIDILHVRGVARLGCDVHDDIRWRDSTVCRSPLVFGFCLGERG